MSYNYHNPEIVLIEDPVRIDDPIQQIQVAFQKNLPWLEKAFGKTDRLVKAVGGKTIFYPAIYGNTSYDDDFFEVLVNDNLKSACFFRIDDPERFDDWNENDFIKYISTISIIFWFQYPLININEPYRFKEVLKNDVIAVLKEIPFFTGITIWNDVVDVFNTYTIDHANQQFNNQPYDCFRITGTIQFNEDCPWPP